MNISYDTDFKMLTLKVDPSKKIDVHAFLLVLVKQGRYNTSPGGSTRLFLFFGIWFQQAEIIYNVIREIPLFLQKLLSLQKVKLCCRNRLLDLNLFLYFFSLMVALYGLKITKLPEV